jgi:hypothetical protein
MSRHQFDKGGGQKGRTGDILSPNDPAEVGASNAPLYSTKISKQSATRVRIGDPLSPVEPGDFGPTGKPYRKGQYAPTIEELSSESLKLASSERLLHMDLPILDDDGVVNKEKLDSWNPNDTSLRYGATISNDVPKHSSAVLLSSFMDMGDWLKNLNIRHVFGSQESQDQPVGKFGDIIVEAQTSGKGRKFTSSLSVYPKFYKYIYIPFKISLSSSSPGLSISSYAVMHSVGHIVFSKLSFDGKLDLVGNYIDSSGWEKNADLNVYPSSFMGVKNNSSWKRNVTTSSQTELSKYSPMDDFAESFALFFANPAYLSKVSPNRYKTIQKVVKEYGA